MTDQDPTRPGGPSSFTGARQRAGRARWRLARQITLIGDRSIAWKTGRQLRFTKSDRFGHELPQRKEFFRRAWHYMAFNGIEGDYSEFGCHGGFTFRMSWHATQLVGVKAHLWGFDSFAGLPSGADDRDTLIRWVPGTMATPVEQFHELCRRAGMNRNGYDVVEGFYAQTLAAKSAGPRPEAIAMAYVDYDLYSSTTEVLGFLESRLRPGSIIGFDDYFCYSSEGPSGERQAAADHFERNQSQWQLVPYVQFGWAGMSFVVERRDGAESVG